MNDQEKIVLDKLKSLESYKYQEKEVTIADVKITLAPLTAGEVIEIFENSNQYNDADASISKLKLDTIARSIIKIDSVKLNPKGMLDDKLKIVSSFGSELVDLLFEEYCLLDKTIKNSMEKKETLVVEETKGIDNGTK